MGKSTIRTAQLISPFGVGSLCEIDGQSYFIRGIGSWDGNFNLQQIKLESLTRRLGRKRLKRPLKSVAVTRFPRWHFCPQCRQMTFWSYQKDEESKADDGSLTKPSCSSPACKHAKLVPMRFVAVCDNGHLDEVNWYGWGHRHHQQAVHGPCDRMSARLKFEVTGKSGGDFSSMKISCSCGSSGSLEGVADGPLPQTCGGRQPGEKAAGCVGAGEDGKAARLYMEPRGSSALHYASIVSAIDIAEDADTESWVKLRSDPRYKSQVATGERLKEILAGKESDFRGAFEPHAKLWAEEFGLEFEEVWKCFLQDISGDDEGLDGDDADAEIDQGSILGEEFPVLCDPVGQDTKWLVTRPGQFSDQYGLDRLIERVVKVERLREVRAFRGFQRRNVTEAQALVPPTLGRAQANPWLPAIQVLGEGVFLQFRKSAIQSWLRDNELEISDFTQSHLKKAEQLGLPARMGFSATPTFILVHTFSHLLINQLSFDCGYSSTSLRERIYCGPENDPYAGILIYTADSDSEGSMGGLSEMGAPDRMSEVIYRAVARGQWCSGDPVCRELEAQGVDGLNRAACHACSLVAETSCTFSNILLDRVLVSGEGKVNGRGSKEPIGYFASLFGAP